MADKVSNVVLNFKMSGQVEYAKTLRDINAIMNAAAAEYKTHIAAMGKDADVTQKLAAEKKKLEIQLEAARERTKMLRAEYEAMAKDTNTTAGQLANKYKQLQNSERAEIALAEALEKVNEELSEQAIEARKNQEALEKLESEAEALEAQTEKLNAEFELQQAQLGENASETEKLSLKLEHLEKAHELAGQQVENYEKQLELAKKQYGENSVEVDKYETKLLEAKTAEQQLANEIKETNRKLEEQQNVLKKTSEKLQETGERMKNIGKDMSMKVTAPIVGLGTFATKSAIDFESAFAGVRKTVDATEEQFAELEKGIRNMSRELPTSASEIAGVAEAAGQLGISTDNILKFTRTVIDLGEATNLTLDQAATEFARFANIMGMSQEDFDRLGSSVVALGNNFATTEAEIVEMGMRLAGAGNQVGMTEAQVMALATAMSSVGIEAEAGGTAMSAVIKKMQNAVSEGGKTLDNFAKAAGMSSKEFAAAFEKDPIVALDAFIKGLAKSSEEGKNLNEILENVGIKGIRESDAILRLAGASDLLSEAVSMSTKAWEENTALTNEAEQRYATTESQLRIFKNELNDLAMDIGEIVIPVLLDVIDAIRPWVERFKESSDATKKFVVAIAAIMAAIGPLLMIIGSMATGLGVIIKGVSKVVQWFGGWSKIAGGLRTALSALTGPIGIIIAVITALIAVGVLVYKNWDTIKEKSIEIWGAIANWFSEVWNTISEGISVAWNSITNFFSTIWESIKEIFNTALGFVTDIIMGYWDSIKEGVSQVWEGIKQYFEGVWELIKNIFLGAVLLIINLVTGNFEEIKKNAIAIWENIKEAFGNIWDGIKQIFSGALEIIWGYITQAWDNVKRTTEIAFNGVKHLISTIWNGIKKFFTETLSNIWKSVVQKFNDIKNSVKEKMKEAYENIKKAWNDAVKFLKDIDLKQIGKDIIQGLIDGIKAKVKAVADAVKEVTDKITSKIKKILGIKSPSRVMMEIGRFIMEGLGIGIENMGEYAVDKTVNVARSVTDAMKDGIEIPEMEIGSVVRQPQFNTTATSPMTAISNIGTNIRESLQGLSGEITVHVYLDSKQLNAQLAPGMSVELNNMNKFNARSQGVIVL